MVHNVQNVVIQVIQPSMFPRHIVGSASSPAAPPPPPQLPLSPAGPQTAIRRVIVFKPVSELWFMAVVVSAVSAATVGLIRQIALHCQTVPLACVFLFVTYLPMNGRVQETLQNAPNPSVPSGLLPGSVQQTGLRQDTVSNLMDYLLILR